MTKNYRFTDNLGKLAEFYRNNYLCEKEIIERGDFKLIEEEAMYDEFKKKDHILTLVHRQQNIINEKLYKEQNDDKVPVMIIPEKGKKGKTKKKEKLNFMVKEREANYFIFHAKLMNVIKRNRAQRN